MGPVDTMRRILIIAVVACTLVALSSAGRHRGGYAEEYLAGLPNFERNEVSAYFYNFLRPYFPNENAPDARLISAQYQGMDSNGAQAAPIEFFVKIGLQNSAGVQQACTVLVRLGNPRSSALDKLYFDEGLLDCY